MRVSLQEEKFMNEKIYNEIKKLVAANKAADTEEKRKEVATTMEELRKNYPEDCAEALERLIKETSQKIEYPCFCKRPIFGSKM